MTGDLALAAGDTLAPLVLPPLTLETLRGYAEASGDHAEVHLDSAVARAFGFPDAIAHGLLVMAWLGRVVSDRFPPDQLRGFSARFLAPVLVGDALTCAGSVASVEEVDGERFAHLDLAVTAGDGSVKLDGKAVIVLR